MSFLNTFIENVRLYPDKIALEFIDAPLQRVTYAELGQLVAQTAMYLHSLGVREGDRVALQLTKSLEFILFTWGRFVWERSRCRSISRIRLMRSNTS